MGGDTRYEPAVLQTMRPEIYSYKPVIIIRCLVLALLLSCCGSKPIKEEGQVTLEDLNGSWTGQWGWDEKMKSSILFKGNAVSLKNFPVELNDELLVVTGDAFVRPPSLYGPAEKLAVLLNIDNTDVWLAIYIYKKNNDDLELRYSVRERMDQRIVFDKSKDQK